MSRFHVPLSSSPVAPSTPGSGIGKPKGRNPFADSLASNPSTTPAGPPPSSTGSFTPAGPPPSSVFETSHTRPGKPLFKPAAHSSKKVLDSGKVARYLNQSSFFSDGDESVSRSTFALPDSSPFSHRITEEDEEEDEDVDPNEVDMEDHSEKRDDQESHKGSEHQTTPVRRATGRKPNGSLSNGSLNISPSSVLLSPLTLSPAGPSPRGVKRSRAGAMIPHGSPRSTQKPQKYVKNHNAPSIAQNMSKRLEAAALEEPDDLILGTEEVVVALYATLNEASQDSDVILAALSGTSERLCNLWTSCRDRQKAWIRPDVVLGIGPDESAPKINSAIFLSTLLLPLHHPPAAKGGQAVAMSRLNHSLQSAMVPYTADVPLIVTPHPKLLLHWLEHNHNPYGALISQVQNHKPNVTAHKFYWDLIHKLAIRGKIADVIGMLKIADFGQADTSTDDGHGSRGYQGMHLENTNLVVAWAIQALQNCPILTDDDWHVPGNAWIIFRKNIEKAVDNLTSYAEGHSGDQDPEEPDFEASSFGLRKSTHDLSKSTRRAESKVPWTILQSLKVLYGILLGGSLEILSSSADWVEATIAMVAWWGGEDDEEVAAGNLAVTSRSMRRSKSRGPRLVDVDPGLAYLRRIKAAYERLIDGPGTPENAGKSLVLPDTSNPVEVALSSIFDGDVGGAIGIMRAMSLPIADAVAEVAAIGGWLSSTPQDGIIDVFDEDERDLLSFGDSINAARQPAVTREAIMKEYAEALFNIDELKGGQVDFVDGWELTVEVLGRLGVKSTKTSKKEISKILKRLPMDSDERIDKVLRICQTYDLTEQGYIMVERYADAILDGSERYGTALIYYARAHRRQKIKDTLDLLVSYSLIQSTAYPALAELDQYLHGLVFAPKESLERLACLDEHAAHILHQCLTGYATVRKFYGVRDEEIDSIEGEDLARSSLLRKTAGAAPLLALINSAADNIHGGLYDESRNSIIHVDGLLTLLGEAMVFVNQTPSILTLPQCISLLKAIEDLSTVSPQIYARCEEFFRSTMAAYRSRTTLTSPHKILKKQMSSMTTGSSFSLVGSSLLNSQTSDGMDIDSGNAPVRSKSKDGVRRGWDWRDGMDEDAKGEDVLRILRLGLAREIAGHWMNGNGV